MPLLLKTFIPLSILNPSTNIQKIRSRQRLYKASFDIVQCQHSKPVHRAQLNAFQLKQPHHFSVRALNNEEFQSEIKIEKDKDDGATVDAIEVSSQTPNANAEVIVSDAMSTFLKMFVETTEMLRDQASKTLDMLSEKTTELSKDGKKYLITVAENSAKAYTDGSVKEYLIDAAKKYPPPVSEILEGCASFDKWKNFSDIRDFCLGIPYGLFLAIGGFVNFMVTGSIPAIRFGVIPGTAILALSISSLRALKHGEVNPVLLKAQAAIGTIIFLRQWRLYLQRWSFSRLLMLLISCAVVAFYVYRIGADDRKHRSNLD